MLDYWKTDAYLARAGLLEDLRLSFIRCVLGYFDVSIMDYSITDVSICHSGGYFKKKKKRAIKGYSHSFRITCDIYAVSLLESRE